MENAPETGWDKTTKGKESQGHKFRNTHPKTLEEVAENFDWMPRIFGFTGVLDLVFKTYSKIKLLKSQAEFKQFCIKHRALTLSGDIGMGKALNNQWVPWAYPMFSELWNLAQEREAKKEYVEAKSWDEIFDIAPEEKNLVLPFKD